MITSRIIFAGINNVKSTDDAQTVALGRLNNASADLLSMVPAKYVRRDFIETGIAFFLKDENGENIFNNAVKLNRLLGGGIHSVETSDYGHEAHCFYTCCPGEIDEVAIAWQENIKHYWNGAFVDCIIHKAGENTCYVSGIIHRHQIQGKTDEEKAYALDLWQKRICILLEKLKCQQTPRFVRTCHTTLD